MKRNFCQSPGESPLRQKTFNDPRGDSDDYCQKKRSGAGLTTDNNCFSNGEHPFYFTLTTSPTLNPVPVGMLPVVVQRTWVTQSSYPAGAPHPPLTGGYVQVDPPSFE